jgi:hypothetical protein
MRPDAFLPVLCATVLALTVQPSLAQERKSVAITLSGTGLVYDAAPDISGVGAGVRASITFLREPDARSHWRVEYGYHRLSAIGATCNTGFPGGCYPESPPKRLHAALAVLDYLIFPSAGIYGVAGIGGYHRSATHAHEALVSPGGEFGMGIAFGHERRVRLELRYARILGERVAASMLPLTFGFQLY